MFTHGDDDEVEPAPGVREVLAEAVGADLDEHLKEEDDREHFVENVERRFEERSLRQLNVHVLSRLHRHTQLVNSRECYQTYHSKNVTCFVGLIPKVINTVLEI